MEVKAVSKSVRISPRKIRLVAAAIRGLLVHEALEKLVLVHKRGTMPLTKLIKSAMSNAVHNSKLNKDILLIKRLEVLDGPSQKRFRPSTRGRAHPYKKRTSNITIVLEEKGDKNLSTKS